MSNDGLAELGLSLPSSTISSAVVPDVTMIDEADLGEMEMKMSEEEKKRDLYSQVRTDRQRDMNIHRQ